MINILTCYHFREKFFRQYLYFTRQDVQGDGVRKTQNTYVNRWRYRYVFCFHSTTRGGIHTHVRRAIMVTGTGRV